MALFACNDTAGLKTGAACRRLGLEVPADVAILGVDNEDILCELSVPPLSSISLDLERIGWEAAETLAGFMDGRPARPELILIPPREVVERASTRDGRHGGLAGERRAAPDSWIRARAAHRRSDHKVPSQLPAKPREEIQKALGRSIHQEIIGARIDSARRLLRDTTLTVAAIAAETGFANSQRFYAAFRGVQGITPEAYRRSYRG